jgi:hypothetical protein
MQRKTAILPLVTELPVAPTEKSCITTETKHSHVRFEAFTAMIMKNVAFWDIKAQPVLHRRHITAPLQSTAR